MFDQINFDGASQQKVKLRTLLFWSFQRSQTYLFIENWKWNRSDQRFLIQLHGCSIKWTNKRYVHMHRSSSAGNIKVMDEAKGFLEFQLF